MPETTVRRTRSTRPTRPARARAVPVPEVVEEHPDDEIQPRVVVNITEVNMTVALPVFGSVMLPAIRRIRDRVLGAIAPEEDEHAAAPPKEPRTARAA